MLALYLVLNPRSLFWIEMQRTLHRSIDTDLFINGRDLFATHIRYRPLETARQAICEAARRLIFRVTGYPKNRVIEMYNSEQLFDRIQAIGIRDDNTDVFVIAPALYKKSQLLIQRDMNRLFGPMVQVKVVFADSPEFREVAEELNGAMAVLFFDSSTQVEWHKACDLFIRPSWHKKHVSVSLATLYIHFP